MRSGRGVALGAAFLTIAVLPGQSCGPFFADAIFVLHQPESRETLMSENPGIIWPDFGFADLALAYRALQGPAFTSAEIAAEKEQIVTDGAGESTQHNPAAGDGVAQWLAARQAFTGQIREPIQTDATVPGQQWQSFGNCLEDAFATAAKTLQKRQTDYAGDKISIEAWLSGQDAVFSNCDAQGQLPAEAQASTPAWLRRDRAYQSAAAHFYRAEWQPAKAEFTAIASDDSSAWHDLASYMIARTMIRRATLSKSDGVDDALLQEAGAQLSKIERGGGRYAPAALALLNYVEVRVNPAAAAARLGDAIAKPDPQLRQDLIDLRYALNNPTLRDQLAAARRSDLVDWVLTMKGYNGANANAHALERWRATRSPAWLASAIMAAETPQPELIAAAAALPRGSPVWATVTFARLRLTQNDPGFEVEVTSLLPQIKTLSTRNAFQEMAQMRAGSIDEFIKLAAMEPAAYNDGMGDITTPALVAPNPTGVKISTMAGLPVNLPDAKRFNVQVATVLNERLPLETLAAIVQRQAFSKQLQFELAMAVWTRAVLLDRPDVAKSLAPAMIEGEPGWKPWLDAYDNAVNDSDRQLAALLALMRFPSVRPYVNAGPIREDGFVGYSAYRDNWWCAEMGKDPRATSSYTGLYNFSAPYSGQPGSPPPQVKQVASPPFVTAPMLSEASKQEAALGKIGDAPQYFGEQSLAWVKAHPQDPRSAELLAFAFRAMRNGCNLDKSYPVRREVFETLHSRYGQSEWAKKFPKFVGDPD